MVGAWNMGCGRQLGKIKTRELGSERVTRHNPIEAGSSKLHNVGLGVLLSSSKQFQPDSKSLSSVPRVERRGSVARKDQKVSVQVLLVNKRTVISGLGEVWITLVGFSIGEWTVSGLGAWPGLDGDTEWRGERGGRSWWVFVGGRRVTGSWRGCGFDLVA